MIRTKAKNKLHLAFVLFMATSIIACNKTGFSSSGSSTAASSPSGGVTCTGAACNTTPSQPTNSCGATSTVNLSNTYSGISNATATLSLNNVGDGTYAGNVTVSYSSGGSFYTTNYSASQGYNITIPSLYDNGTEITTYNYFYNNGKNFSGFFQNSVGALIVAITGVDSGGCATGNLYFQNFVQTGAVQSPYRSCWFISKGPFDCEDSSIMNKSSLYPTSGNYQLLGTFTGLPMNQAFGT